MASTPVPGAQLVDLVLALPDQILMRPGQHLERFGQLGVRRYRPMQMPIGAHKIGENLRVGHVRLPTGQAMPIPIPIHRFRVHREELIASRHQRADEQAPISLGADDHFLGLINSLGDQSMESLRF